MKTGAKILRWPVFMIACLWLLPAAADCEDEAYAARKSVWTSGPFHFEARASSGVRTCGEIDPLKAEYERGCEPGGNRDEYIQIQDQTWANDGFGWRGPYAGGLSHGRKVPTLSLPRVFDQVRCHGRVKMEDRELNQYEFIAQSGDRLDVAETVFVEANTGLPFRFETRSGDSVAAVTIYRHDPLIRIDPPSVDLERRWARSVRHFQDIVHDTDAACRKEVLTALWRGRTVSFQYDLRRFFHTHLYGMRGVFVAPDSIHNRMLSPRFEMEFIAVRQQEWKRVYRQWVEARDQRPDVDWVMGELMPNPDHVGHVQCLGKVSVYGREYRVYNYDLYRVWQSALKFYNARRVLVDDATGLPTQTVGLSRDGARVWVEMRWYEPGLTVEPPPTGSSAGQGPATPLRSMTDDEYRRAMLPEQFAQRISPK